MSAPRLLLARPMTAVVGVGVVAAMAAAGVTGAVSPLALGDPGAVVRWGLPVASTVSTLASSATVGLLGIAAFLTPERTRTRRRDAAARFAGLTATVWALGALCELVLTFASLAGTPLSSPDLPSQLIAFALTLETTRVLFLSSAIAVVVAVCASFTTRRAPLAWLTLLTLVAVVMLALTGHAAGASNHEEAVNSLGVHLVAVVMWVGGLLGLLVMRPLLGRDLAVTVARYSTVALWCYVAIAVTGVQQALIRLGSWGAVLSPYGAIVVIKIVAFVGVGVMGSLNRRRVFVQLRLDPTRSRPLTSLVLVELGVMAAVTGLASVLSRVPPPVPDVAAAVSRVTELTGYPDPGPMAWGDWVSSWRIDWLLLAVAVTAVALYWAAAFRLRRRGDAWPTLRIVSWTLGWALFVWATSGAPGIWGRVLFSVHMVMHMSIAMVVPLLLVPAAPITLALRALPARPDLTWGPREVILQVLHSRVMKVVTHPVVAAALFFFSLVAFYWTDLFELSLTTHTGHLLMLAHFLLTGYLFTWVLIGTDPGVPRWSPLMSLVTLFVTISLHAFFGVALTGADQLLGRDFFTQLNLPWAADPLQDQALAGAIAWGTGEVPTLVLAIVVAVQWVRRDAAEARRSDRRAERDDDADLRAYNEHLSRLRDSSWPATRE